MLLLTMRRELHGELAELGELGEYKLGSIFPYVLSGITGGLLGSDNATNATNASSNYAGDSLVILASRLPLEQALTHVRAHEKVLIAPKSVRASYKLLSVQTTEDVSNELLTHFGALLVEDLAQSPTDFDSR